jgi:iron complex transport system substrate-binding protein
MQKLIIVIIMVLVAVTLTAAALISLEKTHYRRPFTFPNTSGSLRIISLTPSVTETLYYLGAGDMVAARTRYCSFPPEVKEKPELGGLFDINYEALIALSADLVILSELQKDVISRLKALGVNVLTVDHNTLNGVLDSFPVIGGAVGADGFALREEIYKKIADIQEKVKDYPSKKVIVAVSTEGGRFIAAGNDGFYNETLKLLNAENPFAESPPYTSVTKEGLIWIKPDVIAALSYFGEERSEEGLCVITGSFGFTPGPRFPLLMESLARCIYPEAFADGS